MRCPRLSDLPPPPAGKTGWPWTVESPQLPDLMPDGEPWPRISIVTPSYNQGQFIEEAIRSVLLQGYPDFEYIVIDGASTDESVHIVAKYEPWLTYWASETDRGQSDAINKGFKRATGGWGNWLNSDDLLLEGALASVAAGISCAPLGTEGVCFGCRIVSVDRSHLLSRWNLVPVRSVWGFLNGGLQPMAQPSTFRALKSFTVPEDMHYAMDWALYFSLIERNYQAFSFIDKDISEFRLHPDCKTGSVSTDTFVLEEIAFLRKYKFKNAGHAFVTWVWIRNRLARMRISGDDTKVLDCVSTFVRYPEIMFDRMFLGRIRIIISNAFARV